MTDEIEEKKEIHFLPFHAINEFMRNDYRGNVVKTTLNAMPDLPENLVKPLDQVIKKHVKVPGFRNAAKAPTAVKVIPLAKAFENNADVVASVLAAWGETHPELRKQVVEVLKVRGWQFFPDDLGIADLKPAALKEWRILPWSIDRTRMPGFVTAWPKDSTFEEIYDTYVDMFPDGEEGIDNVSLMVVWLTLRLPVDVEGVEDEDNEEEE